MFQEQIAELTAAHYRTHIETYLTDLEAEHTGTDKLRLRVPKVTATSLVGGVIQAPIDDLPILAVDCLDKTVIPGGESLWLNQYEGAIVCMVNAGNEIDADKMVKRYNRVSEHFIKEHQFLHDTDWGNNPLNPNFAIREMLYGSTRFSGSMEVELEDEKVWVAGFAINLIWVTSEEGEIQHS